MGVHIAGHAFRIAAGLEYPDCRRDVRQVGACLPYLVLVQAGRGGDIIALASQRGDCADFGRAQNLGAGWIQRLWRLRHNT
jgi:hypothetical protein